MEVEVLIAEVPSYPTSPALSFPVFPSFSSVLLDFLALEGQLGKDTSSLNMASFGDKGSPW